MRTCKYCGKQILDNSLYCQYCGKSQSVENRSLLKRIKDYFLPPKIVVNIDNKDIGEMLSDSSFIFDNDGTPFKGHVNRILSAQMQNLLKNVVIGTAWQWVRSNEISENGLESPKSYYKQIISFGPESFYFESENKLTVYYWKGECKEIYYHFDKNISIDFKTGIVECWTNRCNSKRKEMVIWGLYYDKDGKWRMLASNLVGITYDGVNIWASSEFKEMSKCDLLNMKAKHRNVENNRFR